MSGSREPVGENIPLTADRALVACRRRSARAAQTSLALPATGAAVAMVTTRMPPVMSNLEVAGPRRQDVLAAKCMVNKGRIAVAGPVERDVRGPLASTQWRVVADL